MGSAGSWPLDARFRFGEGGVCEMSRCARSGDDGARSDVAKRARVFLASLGNLLAAAAAALGVDLLAGLDVDLGLRGGRGLRLHPLSDLSSHRREGLRARKGARRNS